MYLIWTLVLTADFSASCDWTRSDFDCGLFCSPNLDTLILTTDIYFNILNWGSRRVWSVSRGCLLLLGTWIHLMYAQGSVLAHLFLWLVIPSCVPRLITLWYLSHFIPALHWCGIHTADIFQKDGATPHMSGQVYDHKPISVKMNCSHHISPLDFFSVGILERQTLHTKPIWSAKLT
jgi:hypothetical protein